MRDFVKGFTSILFLLWLIMMFSIGTSARADIFHKTELIKVINAETLHIRVEVWPNVIIDTNLMVSGIDTPKPDSMCLKERELAVKALKFTTEMTKNGFSVGFGENGKYAGSTSGLIHIPIAVIPAKYTSQQSVREYVEKGLEPSLGSALIEAGLALPHSDKVEDQWTKLLCPKVSITRKSVTLNPIELP